MERADGVEVSGLRSHSLPTTALFRDDVAHRQLEISVEGETGLLTATLSGPHLEAFGQVPVVLVQISRSSTMLTTTIALRGYDVDVDDFRHLEASVSATWTIDRSDATLIEVAGTAIVTDIDEHTLRDYRAVRFGPCNQLNPSQTPVPLNGAPLHPSAALPTDDQDGPGFPLPTCG